LQADGIEADTLGLFVGPDFADENDVPMPPQIMLFLESIWDAVETDEKFFVKKCGRLFCMTWGIIWDWTRTIWRNEV